MHPFALSCCGVLRDSASDALCVDTPLYLSAHEQDKHATCDAQPMPDVSVHHGVPGVEASMYCLTCRLIVRSPCTIFSHESPGGHEVVPSAEAVAALKTALAIDIGVCSSSLDSHSALLARLRSHIESALERKEAGREAIIAQYDCLIAGLSADTDADNSIPGIIAGRDGDLAAYDSTCDALVSAAREQEQRVAGTANETKLLVDIGTAALASADAVDIVQAATSVAATKRVAVRREYPITECGVEFVPIPVPDVKLTLDGTPVVAGRVVITDVDLVRVMILWHITVHQSPRYLHACPPFAFARTVYLFTPPH